MSDVITKSDADFVVELVRTRSAILLDESKHYLIETRLSQLAQDVGIASIAELVKQARSGRNDLDTKIVQAMATHETSFFRDAMPFEAFRLEVMPNLMKTRSGSRRLQIWSAACSSGQEPYSLSLIINEYFPECSNWDISIRATDISEPIVAKAREGAFRQMEVNRGLPASLLVKHFERDGKQWRVRSHIRKLVSFEVLNLLSKWPIDLRPDVVFIRNVLIYFDVPTKRAILKRIGQILPSDGVLFLGAAETTLNVDEQWERCSYKSTMYYRKKP